MEIVGSLTVHYQGALRLAYNRFCLYCSPENYAISYKPTVTVRNNGNVHYVPQMFLKAYCAVDITKFPFDTQVCSFQFGSLSYPESRVGDSNTYTLLI